MLNANVLYPLKGITAIIGAATIDMGIVTTPQLHWMVRSRNNGLKASESDYFAQLADSFRLVFEEIRSYVEFDILGLLTLKTYTCWIQVLDGSCPK